MISICSYHLLKSYGAFCKTKHILETNLIKTDYLSIIECKTVTFSSLSSPHFIYNRLYQQLHVESDK